MIPKFRAWDKETKEMLDVDIIDFDSKNIGVRNIFNSKSREFFLHEFKDIILMQSTGLNDKNGVEIFEGDIVKDLTFKKENYHVNRTKDGTWYVFNKYGEGFKISPIKKNIEIIGNIHEHPNLFNPE